MKSYIDLNADLGESFGTYTYGNDEALLPLVSSANIACGFHGGDPSVIRRAACLAAKNGVTIGAHPGYPDLLGFGRRNMTMRPAEVTDMLLYQLGALDGICRAEGTRIHYVKPHGALYNMADKDEALANAIAEAVRLYDPSLMLLCPGAGMMAKAAAQAGLKVAREFFADRAYMPDGSLAPRALPGAVLSDADEICARVLDALETETVKTIDGQTIPIAFDSICLHGDNPAAVSLAVRIREALLQHNIKLKAFAQ